MTDSPTRRKRRKATTEVGRSILHKERQRLAREQAEISQALVYEANRNRSLQHTLTRSHQPEQNAIQRSIVKRVAGVLASEEVNVPITVEERSGGRFSAWTDFEKIYVGYKPEDDTRLLAATLRGMLYHEGGHIRFTVPLIRLHELACQTLRARGEVNPSYTLPSPTREMHRAWNGIEDQRMETAVTSDSPRKAAYFTPMIMTLLAPDVNTAAANYPLFVWRRYLPAKIRNGARKLFVLKHGSKGEALAQRIEAVTDSYVLATDALTMYQAVAQMTKLLQECQPLAFNLDDSGHQQQQGHRRQDVDENILQIPVDPDMIEDGPIGGGEQGDEDVEVEYDLTDPEVARHLSEVFSHMFIDPWNLVQVQYVIETPQGQDEEGGDKESNEPTPAGDSYDEDDSSDEDGSKGDESDEDDDSDDKGGSEGNDADDSDEDDDESSDVEGGSTGDHGDDEGPAESDDDLTDEDLTEALEEATAERDSDHALDGDVEAYHDALEDTATKLPPYITGASTNAGAINQAQALADEIEQSFQAATMDRAPAWVEGQRRGIVNVLRYETRQPGDTEFFRDWTDDEAPGFDIAVSVMLDYSGSMGQSLTELAQVGFACKAACDQLDIPCTVTLWDTHGRTLWDATERAEYLPNIAQAGGTDPSYALSDLDNQRFDRTKHIVLIMTDGMWSGDWSDGKSRTLAAYADPGRLIIGFGYAQRGNADYLAQAVKRHGADRAYGINDLMEIPRHLENALIDMV